MKAPAFHLYPKDVLSDARCQAMTNQQFGIYCKLLFFLWLELEHGLPDDPDALARMVHEPTAAFQKRLWPGIRICFYVRADGRLSQKRLEEVRQEQIDYTATQSAAGKAGAAARWGKGRDSDGGKTPPRHPASDRHGDDMAAPVTNGMAENSSPSASPSPSSSPSSSSPPTPAPPSADGGGMAPPPGVSRGRWEHLSADCDALGVEPRREYLDVDFTVRGDLLDRKAKGDPEVTPEHVRQKFAQNLAKQGRDREAVAHAARQDAGP